MTLNEFIIAVIPFDADQIAKIKPTDNKLPLELLVISLKILVTTSAVSAGAF